MNIATPHGRTAYFATREGTNDEALVTAILATDEYGLGRYDSLAGVAVDVGAHIGAVAVALAMDHPNLDVIAVEPVPENVACLAESVAVNGITHLAICEAAAGPDDEAPVEIAYGWSWAPRQPDGYVRDNRYIGGMLAPNASSTSVLAAPISLAGLFRRYGVASVRLMKIDCEGCEAGFLASPEIGRVEEIVGEYHGCYDEIAANLAPTHHVGRLSDGDIGLFRAVRRWD